MAGGAQGQGGEGNNPPGTSWRSGNEYGSNQTFNTSGNIVIGHDSTESGILNFGNGASGANFNTDDNFTFLNRCNRFGITDFGNMNYKKSSTILFLLVLVLPSFTPFT
ncbi:unnamed protein product [Prunus armeniaca]|uniref:Uncharacterized protein n=1 Tax=Prunus armeniaca TaxID=36596 RepID=A0A6J5XSP0_PRUAR|nr:unnamed protein product [Prunus armeniaca]